LGRDLYATPIPDEIDIGVFNAFPKDTELCQAPLALVPLTSTVKNPLRESSTIVICSASPEGLGWHSVLGPGTALGGQPGRQKHRTILFSPGVNRWDCVAKFGKDTAHCRTWAEVVSLLQEFHGEKARVAVFPAGALQLAAE
jgi:hypothetical protein